MRNNLADVYGTLQVDIVALQKNLIIHFLNFFARWALILATDTDFAHSVIQTRNLEYLKAPKAVDKGRNGLILTLNCIVALQ